MSKPSRMEILELLSNGKITAAEAANLLSDLGQPDEPAAPPPPPAAKAAEASKAASAPAAPGSENADTEPSWFRVRVANLETGKNRVTVNIPIRMMKFGLRIGSRFTPEFENLDWTELAGMMKDMKSGMLVDVQDEDSNEHVQVYLD